MEKTQSGLGTDIIKEIISYANMEKQFEIAELRGLLSEGIDEFFDAMTKEVKSLSYFFIYLMGIAIAISFFVIIIIYYLR